MKRFHPVLCLCLAALCICSVSDGKGRKDSSYSVVMLGDTHFDKRPASTYHEGFNKWNAERETNVELYGQMWEGRSLDLLRRAASLEDKTTRMVYQTGDLIMGYTKDYQNHKRFLDDAYTMLKKELGKKVPLVVVVGNHDIRGNSGAVASRAYSDYMTGKMSKELKQEITKTTFSFNIGPDAYIVVDFNQPDARELDRLLDLTEGCRYTFILIHGPVLPYDHVKYYDWILFGRKEAKDDDMRRHFRERLAQRNAIVICGHTHKTEFADWYSESGGRITQLTLNSVWVKEKYGKYSVSVDSPEGYGSLCLKKLEKKGQTWAEDQKALYDEYRPGLKTYLNSPTAGSYKMKVGDDGVTVDFYPGASSTPVKTFVLR